MNTKLACFAILDSEYAVLIPIDQIDIALSCRPHADTLIEVCNRYGN